MQAAVGRCGPPRPARQLEILHARVAIASSCLNLAVLAVKSTAWPESGGIDSPARRRRQPPVFVATKGSLHHPVRCVLARLSTSLEGYSD